MNCIKAILIGCLIVFLTICLTEATPIIAAGENEVDKNLDGNLTAHKRN